MFGRSSSLTACPSLCREVRESERDLFLLIKVVSCAMSLDGDSNYEPALVIAFVTTSFLRVP